VVEEFLVLDFGVRNAPKISILLARKPARGSITPLALPQERDELSLVAVGEKLASNDVALVANSTLPRF
jgi:hypothetical protein